MSRFTVLGGRGQIGTRLVARLEAQGHEVRVPERNDPAVFDGPLGHVVYAIGITADFRTRPFDTMEAHVSVLARVLRQARFDSLLYLSSTRVYSGTALAEESTPLQVNPADPSDLYNLSKLAGEALALNCGRNGVRVARISNVIGAEDVGSPNFIPSLIREAREGTIRLRSHLESAKDYVHIDDVVELIEKVAAGGQHRVYNVASGRQISHGDWVDELQRRYRCAVEVVPGAPLLTFPPISIRRAVAEFGFAPKDVLAASLT